MPMKIPHVFQLRVYQPPNLLFVHLRSLSAPSCTGITLCSHLINLNCSINLLISINLSEFSGTSASKSLDLVSEAWYTKTLKSSRKTAPFLELLVLVRCGCMFTPSEILERLKMQYWTLWKPNVKHAAIRPPGGSSWVSFNFIVSIHQQQAK